MKRKNKGGFSLVEVVVAMAIIVIVSATALTIAISSVNAKINAVNKTQAIYFADNVWECFKAADDAKEFETLLGAIHESGDVHLLEERNNTKYYLCKHKSGKYQFVAEFSANYESARPKLEVNIHDATDGEGGKEIISFSYEKGEIFTVDPDGEGGGE
jgi:prepilin-type N-terminal cleavage/methylation domain-containing protein